MSDAVARLNAALEGRYAIEREIGEGGMATVYLADDLKHERKVALKVLKPELAAIVGAERFLAEIKTTANLQHPHILPLFDSGEADGFLYYVMPYVEGESLRQRLDRERQLPVDDAVRMAENLAEALDYAHRQGVIHRDIKPANVLLLDGKPVISDFGIALAVGAGGGGRLTETGLSLGTPHYMSPEQATGDVSVGAATDIYALGCVLYEMLVGEPPYTGSSPQAILGRIVAGELASAREQRASVPANVDGTIRKALEKLPADRFRGGREFAMALGDPSFRHIEDVAVGAGPGGFRWQQLAMVLGGVAAGVVLSIMLTEPGPEATDPAGLFDGPLAVKRTTISVPVTDRLTIGQGEGSPPRVALSPDGATLAYVAQRDGVDQLFVRLLGQLDARLIPGTEGALGIFFSPDGQSVGFFADEVLQRVPLDGGRPVTVHELESTPHGAGWGPDDAILFGRHESSIWRVPVTGGIPTPVTSLEPGDVDHHFPHVLPGGEAVLFRVQSDSRPNHVALQVLSTGERRVLAEGGQSWYLSNGYVAFRRGRDVWAVPFDLETLEVAGEAALVLEDAALGQFASAGDGSAVYVPDPGVGTRELVWVDRSGQSTPIETEVADYGQPDLSPEGRRLAVSTIDGIWVIDLERGTRSRLTGAGEIFLHPTWVSDGTRVTFLAQTATTYQDIFWAPGDGSGQAELLVGGDGIQREGSWSGDNRTFAFVMIDPGTRDDLWILDTGQSGGPSPLVQTPARERAPRFSPDGRWLAYVSNQSGRDEVYVRPYPGPGDQVTISTAGGTEPVWSRDGRELFYRAGRQIMATSISVGAQLVAGIPQVLFDGPYELDNSASGAHPNYDVSLDGERFVMVRQSSAGPAQLVLIENWFEELRQLVPN